MEPCYDSKARITKLPKVRKSNSESLRNEEESKKVIRDSMVQKLMKSEPCYDSTIKFPNNFP